MKNHDVLRLLATALNVDEFNFDPSGQAVLSPSVGPKVTVRIVSEQESEIAIRMEDLDSPDETMMRLMLQANHLGSTVGSSRFALNEDGAQVFLTERWWLDSMTEESVEARFADFLRVALFWRTQGGEMLLDSSLRIREERAKDALLQQQDDEDETVSILRL